jgi:hypothetical protein
LSAVDEEDEDHFQDAVVGPPDLALLLVLGKPLALGKLLALGNFAAAGWA